MAITKCIQAQKVLYNLKERKLSNIRTPDTIYFDSLSEYECFLMLDRVFDSEQWDIRIHQKMSCQSLDWKLDFTIKPKSQNIEQLHQLKLLCETANNCEIHIPPTQIYIEFKGYQDKNFSDKMRRIISYHPDLSKLIILCSEYDSAFGFWDEKNSRSNCHFIASCYTLRKIIQTII